MGCNILQLYIHLWTLFLLLFFMAETSVSYPHNSEELSTLDDPSMTYTYNRFPEIEKHCGFLISSASELPPDDNRGERMKKQLYFLNGDWNQQSNGAPSVPSDSKEMPSYINSFGDGPPLKLVSFWLKDVDPIRRAKNTVSVSGVMEIGTIRTGSFSYKPYDWTPRFYVRQGTTKLTILFEGIYLESKENGGQGLMCLLGNATIPSTSSGQQVSCDNGDPWNPCRSQVNNTVSTSQDDQIMLVLRYPTTFTLTSRGISGELRSLNHRSSPTYFDEVHISSQLGSNSKYHFGSKELLSKACSPYPYPDSLVNGDIEMFKGDGFCEDLRQFVWNEVFEFVSTGKNVSEIDNEKRKIGPFLLDREIEATYNSSDKWRLMIQELECEPAGTDQEGIQTAMVSTVLRVIQKSSYLYREEMKTGLSSLTLSAEGRWSSSDGQLCMVGCLGLPGAHSDNCNSRITLYFPRTISIKQHSTVLGTISSINEPELHAPLMFQRLMMRNEFLRMYRWNGHFKWSYTYSKIMQAREFQRRSQPSNLGRNFRKSFFLYPSSKGEDIASFSFLEDVLSIEVCAAPSPHSSADKHASKTYVDMVFLSIGSLFGRHESNSQHLEVFHSTSEDIEISGHLRIEGGQFYNLSLFFEGIYDPTVGQMYLIGCRDVQHFQELNDDDVKNLEGGLDCLIEIKVEYPAKNVRWLLNPNIKFSINSKRSKKDPHYLPPVSTSTFLLSYTKKFSFVLLRKGFEEGLRILLLVMAILSIRAQFRCTENQDHPTAYISLIMLGVHALGFSIPLITGDEVFLKWKEFTPYRNSAYQFQKFQRFQALEFFTKFLMLFALLETAKLIHRVWQSRKLQKDHAMQLNLRIPNDKFVFLFFMVIHMVGFFTLHTVRKICAIPLLLQSENSGFSVANINGLVKWWTELENYGGLVQDFFLLPQIIGNVLWGVQSKPLRKVYYIGFTMIRLVLQAYDYASDPVPNSSNSELEYQYLGVESYYKIGNIIVSFIVVTLAVALYVQQRIGFWKIRPTRNLEECENLNSKPEYQRLLTE
ncbi:hypothetical protein ACH5RR_005920 [Cinchona calisaya]|uniref:RING-type E3 ubiquitin transferase n=1 Tax=Cinchona calisaya TaxID=153742 RepID=A0ABD3AMT6_9GENT